MNSLARHDEMVMAARAPFRPSRRRFLQVGALGSALLALNSLAARPARAEARQPGSQAVFLTAADNAVLLAIAPVMLAGALPAPQAARAAALDDILAGVDLAVSGLAPATQGEVRQLFDLLEMSAGRVLAAGVWDPWPEASRDTIASFLDDWRTSWIGMFRTAYLALHELIMAAWYGNPNSWAAIGYGGPPTISR